LRLIADTGTGHEAEHHLSASDRLRAALTDARFSVYEGGSYLGQQIPFALVAPDQEVEGLAVGRGTFSANGCAERLWSVTLGIDGGAGVSGDSTLAQVEVLKWNSFHSQWCDGVLSASGHQEGTVTPGRNLMIDPFHEPELMEIFNAPSTRPHTRAVFSAVRTDVTRADLEMQGYDGGVQAGLAGRGLFGNYALFFPADSIRYDECDDGTCTERGTGRLDLRLINDVILRFDYVAWAAN
jgi:hypothetical protein